MRWKLTSNYGTFTVSRIVDANTREDAEAGCGIMSVLIEAGYEVVEAPDGEEHEVVMLPAQLGDTTEYGPIMRITDTGYWVDDPDHPLASTYPWRFVPRANVEGLQPMAESLVTFADGSRFIGSRY